MTQLILCAFKNRHILFRWENMMCRSRNSSSAGLWVDGDKVTWFYHCASVCPGATLHIVFFYLIHYFVNSTLVLQWLQFTYSGFFNYLYCGEWGRAHGGSLLRKYRFGCGVHLGRVDASYCPAWNFVGGICVLLLQLSFLKERDGSRFNWLWLKSVVMHLLIVRSFPTLLTRQASPEKHQLLFQIVTGATARPEGAALGRLSFQKHAAGSWFHMSERMLGNDTQSCRNIPEDGSSCTNVSLFPCGR